MVGKGVFRHEENLAMLDTGSSWALASLNFRLGLDWYFIGSLVLTDKWLDRQEVCGCDCVLVLDVVGGSVVLIIGSCVLGRHGVLRLCGTGVLIVADGNVGVLGVVSGVLGISGILRLWSSVLGGTGVLSVPDGNIVLSGRCLGVHCGIGNRYC